MWLSAPNISCVHGFSTREGGVSPAPFSTLNLGGGDDDPANVSANRKRALSALGLQDALLCTLKQVHGNTVCNASAFAQEGDALVSNRMNEALAVSVADCYPILFHDPENKIIGAAHAGWRGTVNRIAERTLNAMLALGARPEHVQVAIGPGISFSNFEVGEEVRMEFLEKGFPEEAMDHAHIDLVACNKYVLKMNGISDSQIWSLNRCTFENSFFSYRRDKGKTGRMWGIICMKE